MASGEVAVVRERRPIAAVLVGREDHRAMANVVGR